MLKKLQDAKRGFTLIELLVVIAIIGILSGIVVTSLGGQRARARDARRVSEIQSAALALQVYYDAKNHYPADLDELVPNYLAKNLRDPSTSAKYLYDAYTDEVWVGGTNGVAAGTAPLARACVTVNTSDTPQCKGFHIAANLETNDTNLMAGADNVDMTTSPGTATTITAAGGDNKGRTCANTVNAEKACFDIKNH